MLIFRTINYDAQTVVYFGSAAKQRQYRLERPDTDLEESRFDLPYTYQVINFLNDQCLLFEWKKITHGRKIDE